MFTELTKYAQYKWRGDRERGGKGGEELHKVNKKNKRISDIKKKPWRYQVVLTTRQSPPPKSLDGDDMVNCQNVKIPRFALHGIAPDGMRTNDVDGGIENILIQPRQRWAFEKSTPAQAINDVLYNKSHREKRLVPWIWYTTYSNKIGNSVRITTRFSSASANSKTNIHVPNNGRVYRPTVYSKCSKNARLWLWSNNSASDHRATTSVIQPVFQ